MRGAAHRIFVSILSLAGLSRIILRLQAMEDRMTAFNAVRFRVKPGRDQEFLEAHKKVSVDWPGLKHANMIKTGDRTYCVIAEWTDMEALSAARPQMIATLDSFRDTLEDLGGGLGVTDPVSGPVVMMLK
jgi:quinol monooxygenase YgiN